MPIDSLIAAAKWRRGLSLVKQLPPKTVRAMNKDFAAVIAAEKAGKPIPSPRELAEYVNSEYGLATTHNLTAKWLKQARAGESIS